jgi:hypothetical protein
VAGTDAIALLVGERKKSEHGEVDVPVKQVPPNLKDTIES